MNYHNTLLTNDLYRGNELSSGSIETANRVEAPMSSQATASVEAKAGDSSSLTQEREKELELWMDEVKAFIRKIDIDSL